MELTFDTKPCSLTSEAEYIRTQEKLSFSSYYTNSFYQMNLYDENLKNEFETAKKEWLDSTNLKSTIFTSITHPAHLKIIRLGEEVIPLMLADLKKNRNHWFITLALITRENPVKKNHLGNIEKMAGDWLEWGKNRSMID